MGRAIAAGFAVLLVAALLFAYLGRVVRDGDGEDTAAARRSWRQKCCSCQSCLVKVLPLRAIKIVVIVWQIISQVRVLPTYVWRRNELNYLDTK